LLMDFSGNKMEILKRIHPYLDILEIFSEGMLKVVMHFQSDRMLPFTVVDELAYTEVSQKIVFL
jgi:hypothetical protein